MSLLDREIAEIATRLDAMDAPTRARAVSALDNEINQQAAAWERTRAKDRATEWWAGPYEAQARRARAYGQVWALVGVAVLALCALGLAALVMGMKVAGR